MKKRHLRISSAVCLLCTVLMLTAVFCEGTEPLRVEATGNKALTSDSIKDKQNQISKAEKEKESLKGSLTDLKKVKKEVFLFSPNSLFEQTTEKTQKRCHHFMNIRISMR